jgi:hypothetical protein
MIDPRCSHLSDDLILLDGNVPDNGKSKAGLYQVHAGVKIVNRDNIPRRPGSRIRSECRGIDLKISLALSDPQVVGGIVRNNKDEGGGNDRHKKNFSSVRQFIPIISLVPCEGERANVGKTNQDRIRLECTSDHFRAEKDSELERRLTADKEEQAGVNDAGEDDKGRNDANCRQEEDEKVKKD